MIEVCLLGTGGVMPLPGRWLTSLLIRCQGRMILIDCGEGTQVPLKMAGWGFKAIDLVLFTHFHGDHIAGLPGFLLTLGNSGRCDPLTIMGPPGLLSVVRGLTVISPELPYSVQLIELPDTEKSTMTFHELVISARPADHTLPCLAYCVELKRQGKFDPERAKALNIPITAWSLLQKGRSLELDGRVIQPDMVLGPQRKGIKVCYCTDSRPFNHLVDFFRDADLLVCEGMYGSDDEQDKAVQKKHMTFHEAAMLARQADVNELWLTHFSPSMKEPEQYAAAAHDVFPSTVIGRELLFKTLRFQPV